MNSPSIAACRAASQFFVDCVVAVARARYLEEGSAEWRVLDLIGHGHRANVPGVEYHLRPVPTAGPDYLLPEHMAARGRRAVEMTWGT